MATDLKILHAPGQITVQLRLANGQECVKELILGGELPDRMSDLDRDLVALSLCKELLDEVLLRYRDVILFHNTPLPPKSPNIPES